MSDVASAGAAPTSIETSVVAAWDDLLAASLLGTDRREPPAAPPGPLAEMMLEAPPTDAARALVQQVAALTVLDRAAGRALPAPPLLITPEIDTRPMCSPGAAAVMHRILVEWPMLEHEWLALAEAAGWRLSPDLVPLLLARHRADPDLRARTCHLAGPVADWLTEHISVLSPSSRRRRPAEPVVLPPELRAVETGSSDEILAVITDGLRRLRYTMASRAVVVHFVARIPVDRLAPLAAGLEGLERLDPALPGMGLVHHLLDLVETRLTMVRELARPTTVAETEETS